MRPSPRPRPGLSVRGTHAGSLIADDDEELAFVAIGLNDERARRMRILAIDQFEELFSLTDETTAARFLRALTSAVADGVTVVVTLRADFYDRPLQHDRPRPAGREPARPPRARPRPSAGR